MTSLDNCFVGGGRRRAAEGSGDIHSLWVSNHPWSVPTWTNFLRYFYALHLRHLSGTFLTGFSLVLSFSGLLVYLHRFGFFWVLLGPFASSSSIPIVWRPAHP